MGPLYPRQAREPATWLPLFLEVGHVEARGSSDGQSSRHRYQTASHAEPKRRELVWNWKHEDRA